MLNQWWFEYSQVMSKEDTVENKNADKWCYALNRSFVYMTLIETSCVHSGWNDVMMKSGMFEVSFSS